MARVCADCLSRFEDRVGKGRPFTRCVSCRAVRKTVRKTLRTTKDITCVDCAGTFTVTRTEATKQLRGPSRCDACRRKANYARHIRWRKTHPEVWKAAQDRHNVKRLADPEFRRRKRENETLRMYGLAPDAWKQLVERQDGRCAICTKPPSGKSNGRARPGHEPRLHVDHCHTTDRVRGLLFGNCNTMIGLAAEDPKVLLAAVEYLSKE